MPPRFKLEPHQSGKRTKHQCPSCNDSRRTFTRYIDTETGEPLADHVGRCDRENSCGYHLPPKEYLSTANISLPAARAVVKQPEPVKPASCHEPELLTKYGTKYTNGLTEYLLKTFGKEATSRLIERYRIGTFGKYTVFWQIDLAGRLRAGKLIPYDASRGKRTGGGDWLHSRLKLEAFNLKQCLYGEHLLHDRQLPVAIVESEKTAIIASHLVPEMLWLASGGISGLNAEKLKVLRGRTVVLYPDLGAFKKWQALAEEKLSHLASFTVSDLLEKEASDEDRAQGLDIADLLLREHEPQSIQEGQKVSELHNRVKVLKEFYSQERLHGRDLKLNSYHIIEDIGLRFKLYLHDIDNELLRGGLESEAEKCVQTLEHFKALLMR